MFKRCSKWVKLCGDWHRCVLPRWGHHEHLGFVNDIPVYFSWQPPARGR